MALLPGDDGPYVFDSDLTERERGTTVLDHLSGRFAYQSREVWESRLRAGDILLDGRKLTNPSEILPASGVLRYVHGAYQEPDVPTDWRVLHLAASWMAVAKPAGMPVHSTSRIFRQSLSWQVRRLFGTDWSPVHRLDRDTSGLVLFGRGRQALSLLGRWFSERTVSKRYLALVHGCPGEDFLVDAPLGSAEDPRIGVRQGVRADGKESQTRFRVLGPDATGRGTWVEASPRQGRTHQIRVHLEFAGHPLVGDLLYDGRGGEGFLARAAGVSTEDVARTAGADRMWLHAWTLDFPDSLDDMPRRLVCPLAGGPEPEA